MKLYELFTLLSARRMIIKKGEYTKQIRNKA